MGLLEKQAISEKEELTRKRDELLNGKRPHREGKWRPILRWMKLPSEEAAWNPLVKYPVNKGCFCGSGEKAKKCCLPYLARAISKENAEAIRTGWNDLMTGHWTLPAVPKEAK